jgi:hypothetical protein
MLRDRLSTRDMIQIRPAINRWLIVTIAWQVLVIGACVVYALTLGSSPGKSPLWIVPPMGAAFGIAMPLQLIVMAIVRAARDAR